jgi:hypothetical protein
MPRFSHTLPPVFLFLLKNGRRRLASERIGLGTLGETIINLTMNEEQVDTFLNVRLPVFISI